MSDKKRHTTAQDFNTGNILVWSLYVLPELMKDQPLITSPRGKALCLLKTQFAKKPKNPV